MPHHPTDPLVIRTEGPDPVLRVNAAFVKHFGYDGSGFPDRSIRDRIHSDDQDRFDDLMERGGSAEARLGCSDGSWSPMNWTARTDGDSQGMALLGQLSSPPLPRKRPTCSDKAIPSVQRTLDVMAHIVESKNPGMKCSIVLVDKRGEHVTGGTGPSLPREYNEAIEGLRIGPTVGSCGTAAFWNIPVVVEDIPNDPLWRNLRDAANIAGVAACWSHPITTADGCVLGAMALYADEPAGPTPHQMDGLEIAARMVGLAIEREALEEQLRHAAKMEALGVLAGGIAHDFNNLLAVILGNAELAQVSPGDSGAVQRSLEEIITASLTASGLCDRMLAFAGHSIASKTTFDLNVLAREVGSLIQAAISKKVELEFDLPDEACCLDADRDQVTQVLMNLLTNAAEAIENRPGRVLVSIRRKHLTRDDLDSHYAATSFESGEYVVLQVRDDGAGMSEATQERMFDPFFTTKESGRGLGLAAVRGIVKNHDGGIAVASVVDCGTTFTVAFPCTTETPDLATDAGSASGTPPLRILVVDDEAAVREVMARHLIEAGHSVTKAADGEEAIDLFRREGPFDCLLLDYSLPTLDGIEVLGRVREMDDQVRIVLMSGYTEQRAMDRLEGVTNVTFLHKPARSQDLLAKIAEVTHHG